MDVIIKGWVVKNEDGTTAFFSAKPLKEEKLGYWLVTGACITCDLGFGRFPELHYTSEPISAELIVRKL